MAGEAVVHPVILKTPAVRLALSGPNQVRFLRAYARRAVMLSAQKTGLALSFLNKDARGRPLPENGCFWSLSHKPGMVAGVAALCPVGVDIERMGPVRPGLLEKITSPAERRLLEGEGDQAFFRFWTAKEAVLKAVGLGLSGLGRCEVIQVEADKALMLFCKQRVWRVEQAVFDDHLAAVACRDTAAGPRWC